MFTKFLVLSDQLRPQYSKSLGTASNARANMELVKKKRLPDFLLEIYSQVEGTRADISDQTLMDFLPGFRLIHFSEFDANFEICRRRDATEDLIPFLGNYSSDFICWKDGKIYEVMHDSPEPCLIHESVFDFFNTICDFYLEGVYFLDEDGFLDYDYERERIIGMKNNPGVTYWLEE